MIPEGTTWPHFYQTRSAWSVDQGSNKNHSPAYNFTPTVTKFCVMWEGLSLCNCRCRIVDSRAFPSWSLIHGLRWSGLIKAEPEWYVLFIQVVCVNADKEEFVKMRYVHTFGKPNKQRTVTFRIMIYSITLFVLDRCNMINAVWVDEFGPGTLL